MEQDILYQSEYSKVCKEIGRPLPATLEEEMYCQQLEFESPEWAKKVRERMITDSKSKPHIDMQG